jgi:ATP-dependent HslUV protease ATP-binding subunit HslU
MVNINAFRMREQLVTLSRRWNNASPQTRIPKVQGNHDGKFRLSTKSIVEHLDNYIIGQFDAKRSLAIAIIDRFRRMQIPDSEMRKAIVPSNILLLGPTGCGKTEVARRLARKVEAPFVKVVATKYSEVGFVGEDTSSMIEELAEQAYQDEVAALRAEVLSEARESAVDEVTNALMNTREAISQSISRETARSMVVSGLADEVEIEVEASVLDYAIPREREASPNASYANDDLQDLPIINARSILNNRSFSRGPGNHRSLPRPAWRTVSVAQALRSITDRSAAILTKAREPDLKERAKRAVEEKGIVFIDEFDKMISEAGEESSSFNQKRRGVEKELLTLIEGTIVQTKKLGPISTDHVIFICAGAFSCVSPKHIMPELQGRLPIRCELKPLTEEDFVRILENVQFSLPSLQRQLMLVDGVEVRFTPCGIREIARAAVEMNRELVNTGARRLTTIMGVVMEDIKFDTESYVGQSVEINSEFVRKRVESITKSMRADDLKRYIL